jgi:diaminopimelate decarboxylase
LRSFSASNATAPLEWRGELAPGHGRDHGGGLTLGGIAAAELAESYGTPLVVIDLDVVDTSIAALRAAQGAGDLEVSYAAKAFLTVAFARHLADRGVGLDVCSLGELVTAERAEFPRERLTLHGAGKSGEELAAAAAGRVGAIVVDGLDELRRLALMPAVNPSLAVLLRLNTGIEAHTHAFVRTGGDDTKFGLHPRDEREAAAMLRANPRLHFDGLHAHAGSQIYQHEAFLANAEALLAAAERFARLGLETKRIVVGGGFGVQTRPHARGEALDVRATIGALGEHVRNWSTRLKLRPPRLGIEPGRAIVGPAGTTLYRILAVKRQSSRTFVIVDGGIAENPRPALYGAYHHVLAVRPHSGVEEEVTLCGRSCENDELGVVRLPRDLRSGDLLAMCTTGAYTYSMAGNYNRFPRPAVVGITGGGSRLLARRESLDDVLRNDVLA